VLRTLLHPAAESELAAVRDGLSAIAHRTGAAHEHHGDHFMAFDVAPGASYGPLEKALQSPELTNKATLVRELGVTPVIARHGTRLRIRWEIRDDIHEALVELGCALSPCFWKLN
jgi:hypothetical protein